jgi:hypothetical protein
MLVTVALTFSNYQRGYKHFVLYLIVESTYHIYAGSKILFPSNRLEFCGIKLAIRNPKANRSFMFVFNEVAVYVSISDPT